MITFDDFSKLDIKIGEILKAERVPDTDKLIRLDVDFAEGDNRQIISGIAEYFDTADELVGMKCAFVTNLEPKKIRGLESNGMILAVVNTDEDLALLSPHKDMPSGSGVR